MLRAAHRRNETLGGPYVQLYKNNTDFHGHSYGCHDNYLVSRSIPFAALVERADSLSGQPTGICRSRESLGSKPRKPAFRPGAYQFSQRADFMETELGVDTMHNRPILNTRDEPHADRRQYRRLHLILGDANMCEYATALKVGTTRLVLELIERGKAPQIGLDDPVLAIKDISRDPSLKVPVRLDNGSMMSALDLQGLYCEAARKELGEQDDDTAWIVQEWEETLRLLRHDRAQLIGRVDWVTKLWSLETFAEAEQLNWDDAWLTSLDLEYHNIDPERSLFLGLEADGRTTRLTTDLEIASAMKAGPDDTRGGIRGLCVRRFPDDIKSVQWERVQFTGGILPRILDMQDLFEPDRVKELARILETAPTPSESLKRWTQREDETT